MRLSAAAVSSLLASSVVAGPNFRFPKRQNATTAPYQLQTPPLDTDWTTRVGTNPWPEYPRPQLQRSEWKNLNGVWQWQTAAKGGDTSPPYGVNLARSVLVPFCLESALSGIQGNSTEVTWSWYRTTFEVPSDWTAGNRILLNFDAVDYQATVFVNGRRFATHTGGYWAFKHDITDALSKNGTNELLVFVFDPTDTGDGDVWDVPIGKQTNRPSHIFYRPCTGIWQTVWIESAPAAYIDDLHLNADMNGTVTVNVTSTGNVSTPVEVTVYEPGSSKVVGTGKGTSNWQFNFTVDSPMLWSPDSPTLYNITVKLGSDTVQSYTGFRTISRGEVDGVQRPLLNGKFLFQFGTLDQGFWPDGIYTPPSVEAMRYDLETLKKIGYNMVRKHIKVETPLWFRACDELGLLVIQDMPSLRTSISIPGTCDSKPVINGSSTAEFGRQMEIMIRQHRSYPSIGTWVIYNEGWGQSRDQPYPEYGFTDMIRRLDPTRLVNAITGWHDNGAGDFDDNHHYSDPQCGTPFYSVASGPYDPSRIAIQGEFGGIGHNVSEEHLWKVPRAIREINQTYEIDADLDIWNYRAHFILGELEDQIKRFACSGGVWTQTTDVEGEVNGMLTYDRRILRPDLGQWNADLQALYDAAMSRGGREYVIHKNATQQYTPPGL